MSINIGKFTVKPSGQDKKRVERPKRADVLLADLGQSAPIEIDLDAFRVVIKSGEVFEYADSDNLSHICLVVGVTDDKYYASETRDARATTTGKLFKAGHGFTVGSPLFLNGSSGQLSEIPPTTGFRIKIGSVINEDELFINISPEPIRL